MTNSIPTSPTSHKTKTADFELGDIPLCLRRNPAKPALSFHPLAELFPLIEGEEFNALVEDIRRHGLHEPIVLLDGQILDGRNRYRACMAADFEPTFVPYRGDDPVAYVVSLNLKRRHLDESQRAMVAARLATLKRGDNQHSPIGETSQAKAAELLNVGKRSVERAAEVRDHGAPELQQAVERGTVSVSAAADVATLPAAEQREVVARGEREILEAAKAIRGERAEARRVGRTQKLVEISKGNTELSTAQRCPIICADPPWRYEHPPMAGNRVVENHYPTMTLEDICTLKVSELATPDAILFLWTTSPLLEQSFVVIRSWGFEYRTSAVWIKPSIGMGYFVRQQHELLLIARRGNPPMPAPDARPPSVIEAPRGEHSEKPIEAYELIERMYPELPKIELFARNARAGWAAWGNQAPLSAGAA
jgi:N6-adenosine-specific RNA methylase IME4